MTVEELVILVCLILGFGVLAMFCAKRPATGLAIFLALEPLLSLSRKLFDELDEQLFPSLESVAVFLLLAVTSLHRPPPRLSPRPWVARSVFLFFVGSVLSLVAADDPWLSGRILLSGGVVPLCLLWVASRHVRTPEEKRTVVVGLLAMAIQASIYTLVNYTRRLDVGAPSQFADEYAWMYNEAPAADLFVVPSETVAVCVSAFPLAAWYRHYGPTSRRVVWFASTALLVSASLVTLSRGAWAAVCVALALSLVILLSRRRATAVAVALVVGLAITQTGLAERALEFTRARTESSASRSVDARLKNYALALTSASRHVVLGAGLGHYTAVYGEFPEAAASQDAPLWFAHSLLLTLIPEVGLLGALGFACLLIGLIIAAFRFYGRNQKNEAGLLAFAVGVGALGFLIAASTAGSHLVSYVFLSDVRTTCFTAPALNTLAVLAALVPRSAAVGVSRRAQPSPSTKFASRTPTEQRLAKPLAPGLGEWRA